MALSELRYLGRMDIASHDLFRSIYREQYSTFTARNPEIGGLIAREREMGDAGQEMDQLGHWCVM